MNTPSRFLLAAGVAFAFSGCDSVLDKAPETAIAADEVFVNQQQVEAVLTGGYNQVQGFIDDATVFGDLAAETARHSGSFPSWRQIDSYAISPDNVEVAQQWNANYGLINIANNLITKTPTVQDVEFTEAERNSVIAQALTMRAYGYHNLSRWFGGVPINLTPTEGAADGDRNPERASLDAVYDQIIADLDRAISLGSGGGTGLINTNVSKALLARVLLYDQQYARAASVAGEVINAYTLAGTYAQIYEDLNSSESIWELQYNTTDTNGMSFFAYPSGAGGRFEYAPTNAFIDDFIANGGARLNSNLAVVAGRVIVNKYFRFSTDDDHHFLFRLPEMMLIRAEALAYSEDGTDYSEEVGLINQLRERAELQPLAAAAITSDEALRTAVLNERKFELAFEGHRWHDLVRTGRATTVLNINETRTRWPIPQGELDVNPNLQQNPGY